MAAMVGLTTSFVLPGAQMPSFPKTTTNYNLYGEKGEGGDPSLTPNVIKSTLDLAGLAEDDGESSIYMGFLRRKSSEVNPRAMAMNTVEEKLINLPSDERLRRFVAGDIAIISVLVFFALSSPPTLLSPIISLPFLYLSLGYVLSGKEGL
jgi:hypothetical protein